MSTAQARLEAILDKSLYKIPGKEIKKHLDKLSEEYGEPKATHGEVRAMMDRSLGPRALSGDVYKMREDRS